MEIRIDGKPTPVDLVKPASFAERLDVHTILGANPHRALACALGLCWPRIRRRLPYRGDPIAYGGQVLDQLHSERAELSDVMDVGAKALALCMEIPTEVQVKAAMGNSDAPEG